MSTRPGTEQTALTLLLTLGFSRTTTPLAVVVAGTPVSMDGRVVSGGGAGSAFSGSFNGGAGNSPSTSPAQGENGGTSPNSGGYYCYNQGGGGIGGRTGSWGQSGTPAGGAGNWDPSHQVGISYYDGTTSYVDDTSGNHIPLRWETVFRRWWRGMFKGRLGHPHIWRGCDLETWRDRLLIRLTVRVE